MKQGDIIIDNTDSKGDFFIIASIKDDHVLLINSEGYKQEPKSYVEYTLDNWLYKIVGHSDTFDFALKSIEKNKI
jgi:hypothetical protein